MSVLETLARTAGQADIQSQQRVAYATGAWSNLMESQVYKAAGNELLKMMETKPDEITAKDVMSLAQKYKLNDESMQKLMHQLDQSGAMAAAQATRKNMIAQQAAQKALTEKTGLPADTAGRIMETGARAEAKPAAAPTIRTFTEGDMEVTKQWNAEKQSWEEISRGPKFKPSGDGNALGINSYNLSPEENDALSRAIDNGLDPYKINSRTARIYAKQEMTHPGRPWNELGAQAAYERSQSAMSTKTLLNSIEPLFDQILVAGKKLNNTRWPIVNKPYNWLRENVAGNEDVVAFNNLRDDTVAEIERGLLGVGVLSDSKYLRAVKNINSAQNPAQLAAAIENTKAVIKARLEAVERGPNPKARNEPRPSMPAPSKGKFKILKVE